MKPSICIVGLGYIGLPTALMFATNGHRVHGVDVNEHVITQLNEGKVTIEEPGLEEKLQEAIQAGTFQASTKPVTSDVYILAVPSPITPDKKADFTFIQSAAASIVPVLKKGDLVILESTVPPQTVQDIVLPELQASNLVMGKEVSVSHSPERVIPGRVFEELITNDRIIGGIDQNSAERTAELYRSFVTGKMHLTDATTAELVKVMENTYRDVNIALANELAKVSAHIGVDVWEAIRLANYHPRVQLHQPGPGVGGHCIAVDPWFLVALEGVNTPLIETARKTNDDMPHYTAMLTREKVGQGKQLKVAVLGLAFKGNIDDMRESPSLDVIHYMKELGLNVMAYDPHIKSNQIPEQTQQIEEALQGAEAVVILTNHQQFEALDPSFVRSHVHTPLIIDAKNCLPHEKWRSEGFEVTVLGNEKY